jgi:hypothetical protein
MSFYSAPQGWVCRSCPVPNRTQELISFSASANGSANDHETRGEMMMKLSEGNTMLIWVEGGTGVMLKEQTFELLGVGKVEIGADSIIDVRALAGASWPEVVGGPEGKYQGGVSLMQAEQELIGMNASIQGRQLNTELTGQGGLEVRVVGDAFIAGSGQMAVDWSDGISVEASIADRDQDVIKARVGVMLKEQTFLALTGNGKVVIGDTDLGAHVEATRPEVDIGPEGEYNGMFRLTVDDGEVFLLKSRLKGELQDASVFVYGAVGMRVEGNDVINGSGHMGVYWLEGLELDASVSNGPSMIVRVNGTANVHGRFKNSFVSFIENYMLDEGRMDLRVDMMILNARILNLTGSLISSSMLADVACLGLDAGGVFLGNEQDKNAIGKMSASADLRFANFGQTTFEKNVTTNTSSASLWGAILEHAMIRLSMNSFEDTLAETNAVYIVPPSCSATSSVMVSFVAGMFEWLFSVVLGTVG